MSFDPTGAFDLLGRWLASDVPPVGPQLLGEVARAFASPRAGWRFPHGDRAPVTVDRKGGDYLPSGEAPAELAVLATGAFATARILQAAGGPLLVAPAQDPAGRVHALWVQAGVGGSWEPGALAGLSALAAAAARGSGGLDSDALAVRLKDAAIIVGRAAHDFDNVLQGVIGFTDLTLPLLPPGSTPHQYLTELMKVSERGLQLTRQLHQLSRGGQSRPRPTPLARVLAQEEARLRPTLPSGTRLTFDLPAYLPPVALDGEPLRVVLGHLLDNACEALPPEGGPVTVVARLAEPSPEDTAGWLGALDVGGAVEVAVTDGGPGISPEVRQRLFVEPFFTTKVRHRGLGLAVVYRILHAHRGGLRLETTPGQGTTVRIRLPVARP